MHVCGDIFILMTMAFIPRAYRFPLLSKELPVSLVIQYWKLADSQLSTDSLVQRETLIKDSSNSHYWEKKSLKILEVWYFIDSSHHVPSQWEQTCLVTSLQVLSPSSVILLSFLKGISAPCSPVYKPKIGKQAFFPNLKLPWNVEESTTLV